MGSMGMGRRATTTGWVLPPAVLYIPYHHMGPREQQGLKAPCDTRCKIVHAAGARRRGLSHKKFLFLGTTS